MADPYYADASTTMYLDAIRRRDAAIQRTYPGSAIEDRRALLAEVDRLRHLLETLAQMVDPPEDSMATDEDLARYDGRAEAARIIREAVWAIR